MKPEERATQIWCYQSPYFGARDKARDISFIADHINEAIAHSSMVAVDMDKALKQEFEEGFSAAKAKAAGVVREKYFDAASEDSCAEEWLAAEIEALEP